MVSSGKHDIVRIERKGPTMIRSFSPSSIGAALRCGEQFYRRYILGEIIPPGIAMARGTGVHKASKVNFAQKVLTGSDLPVDDLTDAARDGFIHSFRNGVYLSGDEVSAKARVLNEGLNDTISLTKLYRDKMAPGVKPLATEEFLKTDIGMGLPLLGYIDYREIGRIGDIKTGKKINRGQADKELAPVIYSYLYEKELKLPRPIFEYHSLSPLKSGAKHTTQETVTNSQRIRGMFSIIKSVQNMFTKGVFPPVLPGSWVCSPRWCGYWRT